MALAISHLLFILHLIFCPNTVILRDFINLYGLFNSSSTLNTSVSSRNVLDLKENARNLF